MATRPLWVTDYHGNQLEAVDLGTPTKILKEILDIFGIDEGAEQTRVLLIGGCSLKNISQFSG